MVKRRRRPPSRVWVWTAAALAVVVVAVLAWRGSDAAATSSTTADPAETAGGPPAAQVSESWTAEPGSAAPRRVVESGRVLLTSGDGVAMLDPATGAEAWRYTRSNARLCDATAVNGLVVVLFSTGGRCNELTALRADTGERLWYRNVGFRSDATLASTDRIVLASSPTGLATVDPTGNNIRWHHAPPEGCRLTAADVGSTGVAALQQCADGGLQAVLFDGFDGTQLWSRDLGVPQARLVGADRLVDVVVGDDLQVLSPADGTTLQTLPLPAGGGADEPLQQAGIETSAVVWVRGTAYALDAATGGVRWSVPALGLPSVGSGKGDLTSVVVPEDGGFVTRDLVTGAETARSATTDEIPPGGRTSVLGPSLVVATADRVTAFR